MQEYRLFFFDGDGRISHAHEYLAEDPNSAVKIASAWREGRQMELWQRDRKITCWGFERCALPDCLLLP